MTIRERWTARPGAPAAPLLRLWREGLGGAGERECGRDTLAGDGAALHPSDYAGSRPTSLQVELLRCRGAPAGSDLYWVVEACDEAARGADLSLTLKSAGPRVGPLHTHQ